MGLGKTLQTISLIQYLKENEPRAGVGRLQRPFLVVCPLSVLSSWMTELARWAPGLRTIRYNGPLKERNQLKKRVMGEEDQFGNLTAQAKRKQKSGRQQNIETDSDENTVGVDVVVTTYESYQAEESWFKRALVWRYVVLDEGHKVSTHTLVAKLLTSSRSKITRPASLSLSKDFKQNTGCY